MDIKEILPEIEVKSILDGLTNTADAQEKSHIGIDNPEKSPNSNETFSSSGVSAAYTIVPSVEPSKNIEIYGQDIGPHFYPVKGNILTRPIIFKNLPEAFKSLPITGRPKTKNDLEEFYNNKIKDYVGCDLSDDEFHKVAMYCSPDNLLTGNEIKIEANAPAQGIFTSFLESAPNNAGDDLNIVKKLNLRMQKDKTNYYVKKLKYRGVKLISVPDNTDDMTVTIGTPLQTGKDLLFRVRIYRPYPYGFKKVKGRHSMFSCDLVILGRQKLSALRDRIICPNDVDVRIDVSNNPDAVPATSAKNLFPSGFLFINNVFYVDDRPGCKDYSDIIREWAKKRGFGDFPKRNLDVRLDELVLKLGHPEVYIHQGDCEHLFTFSEVRLLSPSDPLKQSHYPRHTSVSENHTLYCTTCAEFGAKWIVTGCSKVPFDPAFFCETCFKLYLYVDGKKMGDFKAYMYKGNEINRLKPLAQNCFKDYLTS